MSDRRAVPRLRTYLGGAIVQAGLRSETSCLVRDLSPEGTRIVLSAAVPLAQCFDLRVEARETVFTVALVWREGEAAGLRILSARRTGPDAPDLAPLLGSLGESRAEIARLRREIDAARAAPAGQRPRLH